MSSKIYLDACFIVAEHIQGHPFFKSACRIVEKNSHEKFFISSLVLDEVLFSLMKYKISKSSIALFVKNTLIGAENIELLDIPEGGSWVEEYLTIWERTILSPRDAMHLFLMRKNGISSVATFDNDFIDNQKKLGITVLH